MPVRVVHHRPNPDRAGPAVGGIGEEIEATASSIGLVGEQRHLDPGGLLAFPAAGRRQGLQVGALVDIEVHVQRIDRDDAGQRGDAIGDVVALGDLDMPDTPADRCRPPREAEIQLRRVEGGPGRIDLGLAGIARGDGAVEPLPGDDLPRIQQLGSLVFGARQQRRGLGLAQACPGGILRRLEHARVDEEQLLALLYQAAFRHRNVLDVAGDARP